MRKAQAKDTPAKNIDVAAQAAKRKSSSPVTIRAFGDHKRSPYLVDLRPKDRREEWQSVIPYKELKMVEPVRTTIDFAPMVRAAMNSEPPPVKKKLSEQTQENEPALMLPAMTQNFFPKKFFMTALGAILILILPFPAIGYYEEMKGNAQVAITESTNGFSALKSSILAALQGNFIAAQDDLARATESFSTAQAVIDHGHHVLISFIELLPIVGNHLSSREHILDAGQAIALGNASIIKGVNEAKTNAILPMTQRFGIVKDHIRSALPQYRIALEQVAQVKVASLPPQYQTSFQEFRVLFAGLVDDMSKLVELIDTLQLVFGDDSFKRYLIIFQNQHELRPTGGFMGSFAILDVQKGGIVKVEIPPGGTYDLQGQLASYVKPPVPLQLVNGRWEFQDANWFPDFPASARKIEWFYTHARGTTVDGVIALNASTLERLLKILGPIETGNARLVFPSNTVLSQLETKIASNGKKMDKQPKAILSEMLHLLMNLIPTVKPADTLRLLTELNAALREKEIQVYINDPRLEATMRAYGWGGDMVATDPNQDYLSVIETNVQGQKSDAKIEESVAHEATIGDAGEVTDTVTIRRTHRGVVGDDLYGVPNVSFVRVYVPDGAELIAAGGFSFPPEQAFHVPELWYAEDTDLIQLERGAALHPKTGTRITHEFGKTAFGNWVRTMPGETSEVFFTYRLHMRLQTNVLEPKTPLTRWQAVLFHDDKKQFMQYNLAIQKQSGVTADFSSHIHFPHGYVPVWTSDEQIANTDHGVAAHLTLASDYAFGILMQKNN